MKASRPTLVLPNKSSSSPPQLTTITMDHIDPDRISQLSRRKLRGSASEKDGLRRLVLIQNSLVSISPIASPSRSSPDQNDFVACSTGDESKSDQRFGPIGSGPPGSSSFIHTTDDNDEDNFGYVFPDPSLWSAGGTGSGTSSSSEDEDDDDEDPDLVVLGESDWLDSVLSELGDDDDEEPSSSEMSESSSITFHSPYSLRYQSHGFPRVPLPAPSISPYDIPLTSSESEDDPDALPSFDHDEEGSSVYSDESLSEPATPLTHSLLRASTAPSTLATAAQNQQKRITLIPQSRHDLAHSHMADDEASPEDDSPLSAAILPDIVVNATRIRDALKNNSLNHGGPAREEDEQPSSLPLSQHHHHHQQQHQYQHEYFSCHYFRGSYDSF